jgi:Holliday junction resolvasome RuvABC endonuclease subunit
VSAPTLFEPEVPVTPVAAGPRPLVVGADLSLRSTGLGSADWSDSVRPKNLTGHPRLAYLVQEIGSFLKSADLVVFEGGSFGHIGPRNPEELSGLRVMVQHWCWRREIPYTVIPPSTLKLYFAGHGQASKAAMRAAAEQVFGRTFEGPAAGDECDGFALAAAGYEWLGMPLAVVPERQRETLAKCPWPEREQVIAR